MWIIENKIYEVLKLGKYMDRHRWYITGKIKANVW